MEWIVDAAGCDPDALRSPVRLGDLFDRIIRELGLKPVEPPLWQKFPEPGGVTGMVLLTESHLTCHTFPERGFAAFNLYCCRPREAWPWADRLRESIGATGVLVRALTRS